MTSIRSFLLPTLCYFFIFGLTIFSVAAQTVQVNPEEVIARSQGVELQTKHALQYMQNLKEMGVDVDNLSEFEATLLLQQLVVLFEASPQETVAFLSSNKSETNRTTNSAKKTANHSSAGSRFDMAAHLAAVEPSTVANFKSVAANRTRQLLQNATLSTRSKSYSGGTFSAGSEYSEATSFCANGRFVMRSHSAAYVSGGGGGGLSKDADQITGHWDVATIQGQTVLLLHVDDPALQYGPSKGLVVMVVTSAAADHVSLLTDGEKVIYRRQTGATCF